MRSLRDNPQPFNILDNDYATWMADHQGNIEQLLRDVGESPEAAHSPLARSLRIALSELIAIAQQQLQTEEDWQQFEQAWNTVAEADDLGKDTM